MPLYRQTQFMPETIRTDPQFTWAERKPWTNLFYSPYFNSLSSSSHHEGDLLVAKVLPTKQVSYVSHNGMEVAKYQFEVSNKIKQKIENESRNRNGIFDPPTRLIR